MKLSRSYSLVHLLNKTSRNCRGIQLHADHLRHENLPKLLLSSGGRRGTECDSRAQGEISDDYASIGLSGLKIRLSLYTIGNKSIKRCDVACGAGFTDI